MSDPSPVDYLGDPLSEITRKERRNLLIAATVGVLVSKAGLIPSKISTFGIELSSPAQDTYIILVALTIFYFINAFVAYGISDFLIWRKKYQDYLVGIERVMQDWTEQDQRYHDELHSQVPDIGWLYSASKPMAFVRVGFEYVVPLVFGGYSIITLVMKLWNP